MHKFKWSKFSGLCTLLFNIFSSFNNVRVGDINQYNDHSCVSAFSLIVNPLIPVSADTEIDTMVPDTKRKKYIWNFESANPFLNCLRNDNS